MNRSVFQHSPVPLAVIRLIDGCVIEANDKLLRQFGAVRDDFAGQPSPGLDIWLDERRCNPYADMLTQQGAVERVELHMRRGDGHVLICELSAPIFDSDGERMAIFSPLDVTRQKQMEQDLRELNVELEQRVSQRTARLEASNKELAGTLQSLQCTQRELSRVQKMAALGSLVAGVAHELNTPLGNSVTAASTLQEHAALIREELQRPQPSRVRLNQAIGDIGTGAGLLLRNVQRATELVLNFKQVAVENSFDIRRTFSLPLVISVVLATLEPEYRATAYQLQLGPMPEVTMESYPGALERIFAQLVSNSLKHGFDGRPNGTMRLSVYLLGEYQLELRFSDDGVGILPENLERIFDPFFTTRLGQGSSGLGMYIVYNLITDVLGGTITAVSSRQAGTVLTIRLPVVAPPGFAGMP